MLSQDYLYRKFIYIHGSGSNKKINYNDNDKHVWANLSHLRATPRISKLWSLFISDSLLFYEEELRNKGAITTMNFDEEESFLHRIKRRKGIMNLTVDNLYCYSNRGRQDIEKRLRSLNLTYEKLTILTDYKLNKKVKQTLGENYRKSKIFTNLSLSEKIKIYIITLLKLNLKLPPKIRPSTGMASLLITFSEFSKCGYSFEVSGITGQIDGERIHAIDQVIYDFLKNHRSVFFVEMERSEHYLGFDI